MKQHLINEELLLIPPVVCLSLYFTGQMQLFTYLKHIAIDLKHRTIVLVNQFVIMAVKFMQHQLHKQSFFLICMLKQLLWQKNITINEIRIVWTCTSVSYNWDICKWWGYVCDEKWKVDNLKVQIITFVIGFSFSRSFLSMSMKRWGFMHW